MRTTARWIIAGSILATALLAPIGVRAQGKARGTTTDFAWLAGRWVGYLASDTTARAETIFSAPAAGLITGVMRLIKGNEVLVVELITLVDTPNGVEMRFRHFSSALEAYETTYSQNLRLMSLTDREARFENMVPFDAKLMSTQPRVTSFVRKGADGFVGHSDILNPDGTPGVVETTYRRAR